VSLLGSTAIVERPSRSRSALSNGSRLHPRNVDGRSSAARRFRDLVLSFAEGLGGADRLSEAEKALCRTAAGITVELERHQAAAASGCEVDAETLTRLANSQARVLAALRRGKTSPRPEGLRDRLAGRYAGASEAPKVDRGRNQEALP
jgi:hypothetical protein